MVIRLTPDIENALAQEAQRQGTTPEKLALDSLGKLFLQATSPTSSGKTSLFDLLSGYIGTVAGTTEPLSQNCGRRFAEALAAKHEQGSL